MAWGNKTTATQLVSITTEQFFDALITAANAYDRVHCQVDVDFPATPTDNAIVAVYGTLDDATPNWDDTPVFEFPISNGLDPNAISFVLEGFYKYRVGVRRDGATDTIASADLAYRTFSA